LIGGIPTRNRAKHGQSQNPGRPQFGLMIASRWQNNGTSMLLQSIPGAFVLLAFSWGISAFAVTSSFAPKTLL
jgi:hypothetical protein